MKNRFLVGLFFLVAIFNADAQTMSVNTPEGRKTIYADKSKACDSNQVFTFVPVVPQFNQTNGTLQDRLNQSVVLDKNSTGTLSIWCTINCKGEAFGFQIVRGEDDEINKKITDALLQIQSWKSGMLNGKPVDSVMILKIEIKKGKIIVLS